MDNRVYSQIKDILDTNDKINIAVGKNPSFDDMAAALSLYLSLTDMGKTVAVASPKEPLVEHSSLVGIDKVKSGFGTDTGDLIVSFPYREGEIEKISYTLEDGLLNIIVKSAQEGLSFSEKDVLFKRSGGSSAPLFVIGTARLSDLGNLFDTQALKDTTIINLDNRADNQGFGDIVLVSQAYSSVSEQVASLIASLNLTLDIDTAQNLLLGIEDATKNFQDIRTSPTAFEMAALLINKGALRKSTGIPKKEDMIIEKTSSFFPQRLQRQEQKPKTEDRKSKNPPQDWLTPKIYKGSTNI